MTGQAVVYTPKTESLSTSTYMYRRGAGQVFSQPEHIFQVSLQIICEKNTVIEIIFLLRLFFFSFKPVELYAGSLVNKLVFLSPLICLAESARGPRP